MGNFDWLLEGTALVSTALDGAPRPSFGGVIAAGVIAVRLAREMR